MKSRGEYSNFSIARILGKSLDDGEEEGDEDEEEEEERDKNYKSEIKEEKIDILGKSQFKFHHLSKGLLKNERIFVQYHIWAFYEWLENLMKINL